MPQLHNCAMCQHWTSLKCFLGTSNYGDSKMNISQRWTFASHGHWAALQHGKINEPCVQQNFFWFQIKITSNPESAALRHSSWCEFAFLSFHFTKTLNQGLPCDWNAGLLFVLFTGSTERINNPCNNGYCSRMEGFFWKDLIYFSSLRWFD